MSNHSLKFKSERFTVQLQGTAKEKAHYHEPYSECHKQILLVNGHKLILCFYLTEKEDSPRLEIFCLSDERLSTDSPHTKKAVTTKYLTPKQEKA